MANNYFSVVFKGTERAHRGEPFFFDDDSLTDALGALNRAEACAAIVGGRIALYAPCNLPAARGLPLIGHDDHRRMPERAAA